MLVGCVAGRFATTLAMATLRKHALSSTQGFNCIVFFFTYDLHNRIIEQTVYFFFVFTFVNICLVTRACGNEQCMPLFSLDEVVRARKVSGNVHY